MTRTFAVSYKVASDVTQSAHVLADPLHTVWLPTGDAGDQGQLADPTGQQQHYASQAQLAAGGWDQTGIPWDPSVPSNQVRRFGPPRAAALSD